MRGGEGSVMMARIQALLSPYPNTRHNPHIGRTDDAPRQPQDRAGGGVKGGDVEAEQGAGQLVEVV
jgi:hypothetical protein